MKRDFGPAARLSRIRALVRAEQSEPPLEIRLRRRTDFNAKMDLNTLTSAAALGRVSGVPVFPGSSPSP